MTANERLILAAIRDLPEAHGVSIAHRVCLSIGLVYETAERLENMGFVTHEDESSDSGQGFKMRRAWSLTENGLLELEVTE